MSGLFWLLKILIGRDGEINPQGQKGR